MTRLFAGTPWDRPPTCERCGRPEPECTCPPPAEVPTRLAPESQTARLRLEKRARGKIVTVVSNLDTTGNDLPDLARQLKSRCGAGGTVQHDLIELQGDHVARAEELLLALGYKTRRA
jgi:translation initiation factor 1